MATTATHTPRATWPDGTPRSQGNAFDWRHTPSGVDLRSLYATADKTPKNPGGLAKHGGTIAGGLSPRRSGLTINDGADARATNGSAVHTATARAEKAAQPAPKLRPVTAQRHHTGAYSKAAAA